MVEELTGIRRRRMEITVFGKGAEGILCENRTARAYGRYAIAALFLAPFACGDSTDHPGDARVLDVACAQASNCPVSATGAKRVSGLTADSTGFKLGPGEGTVTINVPALKLPGSDDTWTYEILARGTGSFDVPSCFTPPIYEETGPEAGSSDTGTCITTASPTSTFDWIPVGGEGHVGTAYAGRTTIPTPLSFHVKNGATLEIVDIRIVSSIAPTGCGG